MFITDKELKQVEKKFINSFQKVKEENNQLVERIIYLERKIGLTQDREVRNTSPKIDTANLTKENITKLKSQISYSEKEILQLLQTRQEGMTYENLASMLGKSPKTIQAQLLNIIRMGVPISWMKNTNGQKNFYLDKKALELMIKTGY